MFQSCVMAVLWLGLCVHSLRSKKFQSYSHPSVHVTFKYLDSGLKARQWTPAVWYRVPVFTQEMKMKCRVLWEGDVIYFVCLHKEVRWINPPAVVWQKWEDQSFQLLCYYCSFMNVLSFKEFILFTYRQIYHTFTCEWFVWFRIKTYAQWFSYWLE